MLDRNPGDLELVEETTPDKFREWLIEKVGEFGRFPLDFVERLPDPRARLAPLLDSMTTGDSLWLCRTKRRGPLYGNEGVALVRDGKPILYVRVIQY